MFYDFAKRAIDFVGAFFGLMIFIPVMIVIALAIMRESKGPAIFTQPRVSRGGKTFRMQKFRSMLVWGTSDQEFLNKYPKLMEKFRANNWKIPAEEDPRITKIGRFIRKTSIDELPQFWNVLTGDMSLVGPRAFRPEELEEQMKKFPETKKYVEQMLTVKPGITGPWQVGGRSKIDFPERVRMDAEYAKKRSLLYDLKIIIKTPLAVIHQEGAY